MKTVQQAFRKASVSALNERLARKQDRNKTPRDCPRVTLRLSVEDHERLKARLMAWP